MAFEEIKELRAEFKSRMGIMFKILDEIRNALTAKSIPTLVKPDAANALQPVVGCIDRIKGVLGSIQTDLGQGIPITKTTINELSGKFVELHSHFTNIRLQPRFRPLTELQATIVNHLNEFGCKEKDDINLASSGMINDFFKRWNAAIAKYKPQG